MDKIDLQTYKAVFDMIPIGLGIAAMNGKLLIYNQAMLEPGEYVVSDIEALESVAQLYYDPTDRDKVLGIARTDGKLTNYKIRFKKKNGEPYYTLMSLRPVTFQGQPGWLAAVLDIDDQVKAESEIIKNMEEIEKLNKMMVGRELKMAELKEKLDALQGTVS